MATVAPGTTADAIAALLRDAARRGQPLVPVGGGTKSWRRDASGDAAMVETSHLRDGFAHFAGDLVATLPAGMTLAEANARLALSGQWLPLDPPFGDRATIGGIVATNDSGPRRHRHGAPRDLIVGIELALTDGRVVRAGGRVVKNVAGYDLSRLFCGSHGSLGIVTSATFKLAPVAPASCTLVTAFPTVASALAAARAVAQSFATPSAIELQAPAPVLLVRFETTRTAAEHMADATTALLASHQGRVTVLAGSEEATAWHAHDQVGSASLGADATLVKASVLPSAAGALFESVERSHAGCDWSAIGRAAAGVYLFRVAGTAPARAECLQAIWQSVSAGGHARVLASGTPIGIPVSAPAPAASVMHMIKARFDPSAVLPRVPDGS